MMLLQCQALISFLDCSGLSLSHPEQKTESGGERLPLFGVPMVV
jgi:hypothetical protein